MFKFTIYEYKNHKIKRTLYALYLCIFIPYAENSKTLLKDIKEYLEYSQIKRLNMLKISVLTILFHRPIKIKVPTGFSRSLASQFENGYGRAMGKV